MTIRQREHTADLAAQIRIVEERSIIHSVAVCNERDLPTLRRYIALCERDHGGKQNAYSVAVMVRAKRLLAEALEVAELERMARR